MRIAGVASAFPPQYYPQPVIAAALESHWSDTMERPEYLGRFMARVGVEGRHLALPMDRYEALSDWGERNDHWIDVAEDLAEQSICRALTRAGLSETDLDAIFFVSVTGIAAPSIDARLINRMNLRTDIKRIPIFGLGCVAGAAGIARAADYVRGFPDHNAVLVAVELCSLTWQRNDQSAANLISTGLFGDGSAAVIVSGESREASGPEVLATRSSFYRGTEDVMGWDISSDGFKVVLSMEVPNMVRKHLAHDVNAFLTEQGLTRDDIATWIMHTGGPKVLEATAEALNLPDGALQVSWDCLAKAGNLSSASVLMVLEEFVNRRRPAAGSYSVLAAMGPGFCSELVLLRW
ncbi:MAG TPA: 3-oxoacyl-[acyl-carrier-protein] synthase III C-terminal domain-containing protein [Candidatus Angelobacter sp.]|nr:3-oxoacyl-[acyl-carrier-protein] synthase III C-terminal domain-containing protein [Candidatus Angelobacter sp.]